MGGAAGGRSNWGEKSRTRTADTAISYRGGPESRRRRRIPPCDTDLITRPGEPIQFSPLVLPPVAAERIICATRHPTPGAWWCSSGVPTVGSVGAPGPPTPLWWLWVVSVVTHLAVESNDKGTRFLFSVTSLRSVSNRQTFCFSFYVLRVAESSWTCWRTHINNGWDS